MNVVSLFDGIAIAALALKKSKVKVQNYFFSEKDEALVKFTLRKHNFSKYLDVVENITHGSIPKKRVDLLIGGPPCPKFSRINFYNGKHTFKEKFREFFDYLRIYNMIKPDVFLYENVKMSNYDRDVISERLKCDPIMINSSLMSAQNRNRYYWTNAKVKQPKDKKIFLKDVMLKKGDVNLDYLPPATEYMIKRSNKEINYNLENIDLSKRVKSFPVLASWKKHPPVVHINNAGHRRIHPVECERLQTIPDNYTGMLSGNSNRYHVIGNAFTLDVISHIISSI